MVIKSYPIAFILMCLFSAVTLANAGNNASSKSNTAFLLKDNVDEKQLLSLLQGLETENKIAAAENFNATTEAWEECMDFVNTGLWPALGLLVAAVGTGLLYAYCLLRDEPPAQGPSQASSSQGLTPVVHVNRHGSSCRSRSRNTKSGNRWGMVRGRRDSIVAMGDSTT